MATALYTSRTNDHCRYCPRAHNGINGRFCNRLKRYVEHARTAPCLKKVHQ